MSTTNLQKIRTALSCSLVLTIKLVKVDKLTKYIVRPNFYGCLLKLQGINHNRYSWADIGREIGMSRQAAQNLFMNEATDDGFAKYGTLAALLSFFDREGMPITVGDLLTVSYEPPPDDPT